MTPRWVGIVVHHTTGDDTDGLELKAHRDYHMRVRQWRELGYHFVVEVVDGMPLSICGRPFNWVGAHAGPAFNSTHLGVAVVGDFSENPPPAPVMAELVELIAGLCDVLLIPTDAVVAHRDVKATVCPGKIDMAVLRAMVDRARVEA